MLAILALRNLYRNRRRTLLALLVISVGTAGLLLTAGFIRYSFNGLRDAIINGGLGHFEVRPGKANADDNASQARVGTTPVFAEWTEARAALESSPYVLGAGAAIQFAGVATNGDRTASFLGVAVEPERERRMGVTVRIRSGRNLQDTDATGAYDEVLLGAGLARELAVAPSDTITVLIAGADGSLNAVDLTVAGSFSSGFQDLDDRILKVHVATAQRLLGTNDVTSLVVNLRDTQLQAEAEIDLRQRLAALGQPLSLVSWNARAPFYEQVRALYGGIFVFLGAIVATLVALATSNTLMMSVLERIREFGTLLAIGTTRAQLAALLMWEGLWLGLLGSTGGGVLGFSLAAVINAARIQMPPPPAAVDPIDLALAVVPADLIWALGFMLFVLFLAVVPPVLRLFRLKIVEALGHV